MNAVRARAAKKRLSILIADDERDTVLTLAAIFEDEGHVVHSFYRGDEVIPAVKRYQPDICILDLDMPGRSGYALAQHLSALGEPRPVLIAISGRWNHKSDELLALSVGFDRFYPKPADPRELVRVLDDVADDPR